MEHSIALAADPAQVAAQDKAAGVITAWATAEKVDLVAVAAQVLQAPITAVTVALAVAAEAAGTELMPGMVGMVVAVAVRIAHLPELADLLA